MASGYKPPAIKKSKEGTFSEWAKAHGFSSTEAAAKHVMANTEKYPPSIVKKANFARNASKWKKSGRK